MVSATHASLNEQAYAIYENRRHEKVTGFLFQSSSAWEAARANFAHVIAALQRLSRLDEGKKGDDEFGV